MILSLMVLSCCWIDGRSLSRMNFPCFFIKLSLS
ncbi:hypothetical protein HU200_040951 [Digitaria exilis]|uniref:Uncharacterized protein n=1 Tax=Digitaria exilis TaxID=1010633 RepID=A0A835B7P6_9POAL|nr:hypothetical protein HU200_040951 [Digitaria exilis]